MIKSGLYASEDGSEVILVEGPSIGYPSRYNIILLLPWGYTNRYHWDTEKNIKKRYPLSVTHCEVVHE